MVEEGDKVAPDQGTYPTLPYPTRQLPDLLRLHDRIGAWFTALTALRLFAAAPAAPLHRTTRLGGVKWQWYHSLPVTHARALSVQDTSLLQTCTHGGDSGRFRMMH